MKYVSCFMKPHAVSLLYDKHQRIMMIIPSTSLEIKKIDEFNEEDIKYLESKSILSSFKKRLDKITYLECKPLPGIKYFMMGDLIDFLVHKEILSMQDIPIVTGVYYSKEFEENSVLKIPKDDSETPFHGKFEFTSIGK